MGLSNGWMTKANNTFTLAPMIRKVAGEAGAEPPKRTTARGQDPLQRAREVCNNAMHISVHALLEPGCRERARMIPDLLAAPRLYHGRSTKGCRSPASTLEYYARAATGTGWAPVLQAMVETLKHGDLVECWGLETQTADMHLASLDLEHPRVVSMQGVAAEAGELVTQGLAHLSRGFLLHNHMWPGKLVALGSPDPEVQAECLAEI